MKAFNPYQGALMKTLAKFVTLVLAGFGGTTLYKDYQSKKNVGPDARIDFNTNGTAL